MLVLVCSNRHQTHIEFSFRKREDLCTALVEALREFILIAGIPARLQVNHGCMNSFWQIWQQRLGIQDRSCGESDSDGTSQRGTGGRLSPLTTPESMN